MSSRHFPLALVLSLLFISLPHPAMAGAVEEMAEAFRSANGVVIMPAGEEYLIDLDAAKGLREGDLLTVVTPGEKIVHPVSGAVLGSLDEVRGVLQVTRVKAGYSYARPLDGAAKFGRGDLVRRWDNVPASFAAGNAGSESLRQSLQAALAHLDWRPAGSATPLTFVVADGRLQALGAGGGLLVSAPLGEPALSASLSPPAGGETSAAVSIARPAPAIVAAPPAPAATSAIVRRDAREAEGIWLSPEFLGEAIGVHVADLDGNGRQEVVMAFPYRLEAGQVVNGTYTRLDTLDLGFGQKGVALDGADLDGDGRPELFVTAGSDGELRSLMVGFTEGKLQVKKTGLPWYIRAVHLPGEGRVLLGQRMGGLEADFAGPIFRLAWRDGAPAEGSAVETAPGITLFGFAPLAAEQRQTMVVGITVHDELKVVDAGGNPVWRSESRVGGSEAFIERADPSKNPAEGPATRNVFMQGRMIPDPEGLLLIPVNEGSRLFSRARSFDKSWIQAMAWNGFALQEVWRTQPQGGYLADFRLADADNDGKDELVQAVIFSRDGMMSKARSALVIYELP